MDDLLMGAEVVAVGPATMFAASYSVGVDTPQHLYVPQVGEFELGYKVLSGNVYVGDCDSVVTVANNALIINNYTSIVHCPRLPSVSEFTIAALPGLYMYAAFRVRLPSDGDSVTTSHYLRMAATQMRLYIDGVNNVSITNTLAVEQVVKISDEGTNAIGSIRVYVNGVYKGANTAALVNGLTYKGHAISGSGAIRNHTIVDYS